MSDYETAIAVAGAWNASWLPATFGERTHCIEAAKIGLAVLKELGVTARPLPCAYRIANPLAHEFISTRQPVSEWPDDAWAIGVDPDSNAPGPGWNGHVVVLGDGFMLDLSAGQFHRRHIPSKAYAAPLDDMDPTLPMRFERVGDDIVVEVWPRPELRAWKNGSAWRLPVTPKVVDSLVAGTRLLMQGFTEEQLMRGKP